jgi:hypothetical protein
MYKESIKIAIPQLLKTVASSTKNLKIAERYCSYDERQRSTFEDKKNLILTALQAVKSLS